MKNQLKQNWSFLMDQLNLSKNDTLYEELLNHYQDKTRYYHNIEHIYSMLTKSNLFDYSVELQFSIWFHDVIYNPLRKDNEEQSARFMIEKLSSIQLPTKLINEISRLILLTKNHKSNSNDVVGKQLLDLDLLVLGSEKSTYLKYCQNIRLEYKIYPDMIYYPARKKVIEHFLSMENIYQTIEFKQYEFKAKDNLLQELKSI